MRITLPTNSGWMVEWYTGEVRTIRYRNGRTVDQKVKDSFESTSKEKVDDKIKELKENGLEVIGVYECCF